MRRGLIGEGLETGAQERVRAVSARKSVAGDLVAVTPHGRYLIFFRLVDKRVRIERIMHSARDIDSED